MTPARAWQLFVESKFAPLREDLWRRQLSTQRTHWWTRFPVGALQSMAKRLVMRSQKLLWCVRRNQGIYMVLWLSTLCNYLQLSCHPFCYWTRNRGLFCVTLLYLIKIHHESHSLSLTWKKSLGIRELGDVGCIELENLGGTGLYIFSN